MKKSILVCVILLLSMSGHAVCPTADLTGDCHVGLADLAVMANQWMTTGTPPPAGLVFVDIPGDTFYMGDSFNEGYSGELPVHTVTLSPFRMSKYEVTNAQYAEYLNAADADGLIKVSGGIVYAASDSSNIEPYLNTHSADPHSQIDYTGTFTVRSKSGRDMSNDPVVEVSWYGAKGFCDYYGYRLPTEAEWEYAARGGLSAKRFPWGDTISHSQANYFSSSFYSYDISPTRWWHASWDDGVYPYTAPVGSFAPHGYGLYDVAGNVWEWCRDRYDSGYYNSSPQQDPQGPVSGGNRVWRGGDWSSNAEVCRNARRVYHSPSHRFYGLGFRCAQDFQ